MIQEHHVTCCSALLGRRLGRQHFRRMRPVRWYRHRMMSFLPPALLTSMWLLPQKMVMPTLRSCPLQSPTSWTSLVPTPSTPSWWRSGTTQWRCTWTRYAPSEATNISRNHVYRSERVPGPVEAWAWMPERLKLRSQVQAWCHPTILQAAHSTICCSRRLHPSLLGRNREMNLEACDIQWIWYARGSST